MTIKIPVMKTIKESAKIVGLSEYFIRQLVLKNKIKFVKSGAKYLVNVDYLIDFLNTGEYKKRKQNASK